MAGKLISLPFFVQTFYRRIKMSTVNVTLDIAGRKFEAKIEYKVMLSQNR
jgi:hypothetical protein